MKKIMLHVFGVIIFIYILTKVDFNALIGILAQANILFIILSLLLNFLVVFIKAYKWRYIMKQQGITYNNWDSCLMYASGMYLGLVTPGRMGEFARTLYLKKDHSFGKGFASVFFDRFTDFLVLIFIVYLGLIYFLGVFKDIFIIFILLFSIGILMTAAFFINKGMLISPLSWIFRHTLPSKYHDRVKSNLSDFLQGIFCLNLKDIFWIGGLTVVSWVLYLYQVYLMSLSISLNVSFFFISICVALAGMVSVLPITVLGLGTRDATFIFLFALEGLSKESAVALSALTLLIFLSSAGIGLCAWFKRPIRIKKI